MDQQQIPVEKASMSGMVNSKKEDIPGNRKQTHSTLKTKA